MVCILCKSFGINPTMANNQATEESLWNLYRHFSKLEMDVTVKLVKVPAASDTYQQLIGQRDAYKAAADHLKKLHKQAC